MARQESTKKPESTEMERTTMFLDRPLMANLRYWSQKTGDSQAEITRKALEKYLREDCELEPNRVPIVELQHRYA